MIEKKFLVHTVLGHSYLFAFLMFLAGFFLDHLFPVAPMVSFSQYVGFGLIVIGTFFTLWAQTSTHKNQQTRRSIDLSNPEHHNVFHKGPYKYVRTPTHIGIFLIFFGFGFLVGSFFVPITAIIAFIINRFIFITKEEKILVERYGEPYKAYKKRVKF